MTLRTNNPYEATFFVCCGGWLRQIYGTYPNNGFLVRVPSSFFKNKLFKIRRSLGLVHWYTFQRTRRLVKKLSISGLQRKNTIMSEAFAKARRIKLLIE